MCGYVCVDIDVCAMVNVLQSEDNFGELVISYHVGPGAGTQEIRLGSRLHLLRTSWLSWLSWLSLPSHQSHLLLYISSLGLSNHSDVVEIKN